MERRTPRWLITIATLVYGVLPLLADFSETHVFHPRWTPHARFHTVWLLATQSAVAVVSLYLLWASAWDLAKRIRLAGVLGLCVLGGFAVSAITRGLYGGALADSEGGVPSIGGIDANLLVFSTALALVALALWLDARGSRRRRF